MRLPFGLDLKSIIVGGLLAYFVLPYIVGYFSSKSSTS